MDAKKDRRCLGRVVVFGDSMNDLPMFEIADKAISVANAMDKAKEASDITIGSNEEDAVADYIRREEEN